MWRYRRKAATYKPQDSVDTKILDSPSPGSWENKFLLFKLPRLWYFVDNLSRRIQLGYLRKRPLKKPGWEKEEVGSFQKEKEMEQIEWIKRIGWIQSIEVGDGLMWGEGDGGKKGDQAGWWWAGWRWCFYEEEEALGRKGGDKRSKAPCPGPPWSPCSHWQWRQHWLRPQ